MSDKKPENTLEFFKASDFVINTPSRPLATMGWVSMDTAAQLANRKLNQVLGPKVLGYQHSGEWHFGESPEADHDTHSARLFNIQPIVKECSHEIQQGTMLTTFPPKYKVTCVQCGKSLKQVWTVAE